MIDGLILDYNIIDRFVGPAAFILGGLVAIIGYTTCVIIRGIVVVIM